MFDEFAQEVFFIKIKVKSLLQNITLNTSEKIETSAIKNKNKLVYHHGNTKIQIEVFKDNVLIVRENDNFIHKFDFKLNKETKSEYYIKEYNSSIEVNITTTKLVISDKKIIIDYTITDSNDKYNYILDME